MKRIKDQFLDNLESVVKLQNKAVSEFGCGSGEYSEKIAARCRVLTGIDPDAGAISKALGRKIPNAKFLVTPSTHVSGLTTAHFGVTMFTNSLHHVFVPLMPRTLDEAVRVTEPDGYVVILEPAQKGGFFESEIRFNACDGDERNIKDTARRIMLTHPKLKLVKEIPDETAFRFDNVEDFLDAMKPTHAHERFKNMHCLERFLSSQNFVLKAERHISIFKPRP